MDLNLTDEQTLLRDSAFNCLAKETADRSADDRARWKEFAELGWLALPLPGEFGGLEQGALETGMVTEAIGYRRVREPYVSTVVLCGGILAQHCTSERAGQLLSGIAAGDLQVAFAQYEGKPSPSGEESSPKVTIATPASDRWRISGRKRTVPDGGEADYFLVTALIQTTANPENNETGVFLVPSDSDELARTTHAGIDGSSVADLVLSNVSLPADSLLCSGQEAITAIQNGLDKAVAAANFELLGIMTALLDTTVDFTKNRKQFGRPLAANQVLRHRLAELSINCEEARSLALRAAIFVDSRQAHERGIAVSGAQARIAQLAQSAAHEAIQMHGAMGVTEELPVGSYLRRVLALGAQFGSPEYHLTHHMRLSRDKPGSTNSTILQT